MTNALTGAPWLSAMARVFDSAGAELYIVGGAVRNPLMGLPLSDIDVCGPLPPHDVCAICEGTQVRTVLRAPELGTVELHVTDENGCDQMAEYTCWRQDIYSSGHRPDRVQFTKDISVDAVRRDFSVNAMYQRVHADHLGPVIDPTGGLDHLKKGLLHTVTADPDLVLANDGLRILRAVRFQAELDLQPTPEMTASLGRHAHLTKEIAPERLREELHKVLMADLRYPMLPRRFPATYGALSALHRIGLWESLFGGVAWDEEAAASLRRFSVPDFAARMALLMRRAAPEEAAAAMHHMRFPSADAERTQRCVSAMHKIPSAPLAELAKLGRDALQTAHAAFCALGDEANAHAAEAVLHRLHGKPMTLRELSVSGSDLKPLFVRTGRPLREMGAVLEALWRAVLEDEIPNERGALMNHPILGGSQYQ